MLLYQLLMLKPPVKNESLYVQELLQLISEKKIIKPKFQRKKKWDTLPNKKNQANEQDFIEFLYQTQNSVHSITLGQKVQDGGYYYTNIDGNNRLNAIYHFMDRPFEIFPDYIIEILTFIETTFSDDKKERIKELFKTITYTNFINLKFRSYFNELGEEDLYNECLKPHRDSLEELIEKVQEKLKIDRKPFDTVVKINVNKFDGYDTGELCQIFENINKYNNKLTGNELLACQLYNEEGFEIKDRLMLTSLREEVKQYYINKSEGEVLPCHQVKEDDLINAYDFTVGLQNYCHNNYKYGENYIIEEFKIGDDGLALFFKLFQTLNDKLENNFTTENVNNFIDNIKFSCEILLECYHNIFPKKIKLFNDSCKKKFKALKKNHMRVIISSIMGYKKNLTRKDDIIISIEKTLLYHFNVSDIKDQENKDELLPYDILHFPGAGQYIDNLSKKLLNNPSIISDKITKDHMRLLLETLLKENLKEEKPRSRRNRKFFEKCIVYYFYKQMMPTNLLSQEFSIEHIVPFSSLNKETIDIDRLGNIVPIIAEMNNKRRNSHINKYLSKYERFLSYIKPIIPSISDYDNIVNHNDNLPKINNREIYNTFCEKNENTYIENFLVNLFI